MKKSDGNLFAICFGNSPVPNRRKWFTEICFPVGSACGGKCEGNNTCIMETEINANRSRRGARRGCCQAPSDTKTLQNDALRTIVRYFWGMLCLRHVTERKTFQGITRLKIVILQQNRYFCKIVSSHLLSEGMQELRTLEQKGSLNNRQLSLQSL